MALDPTDLQPPWRGPVPFIDEFRGQPAILRPVLEHNIGRLPEVETHAPRVDRPLEARDVWRRAGNTLHRRDQSAHSHLEAAREHLALYLHLTETSPLEQSLPTSNATAPRDPDDDRPTDCTCDPLHWTPATGHLRGCPLRGRRGAPE